MISTKKIIGIILVILVVVSVLLFLFKTSILDYLKNLPGFGNSNGEDIKIGVNDEEVEDPCKFLIAKIDGANNNKIIFCKNFDFSCSEKIPSNLIYKEDGIFIDQGVLGIGGWIGKLNPDEQIAEVVRGKILIYSDILNKKELYEDLKGSLPEISFLQELHHSEHFSGNFICRGVLVENEK